MYILYCGGPPNHPRRKTDDVWEGMTSFGVDVKKDHLRTGSSARCTLCEINGRACIHAIFKLKERQVHHTIARR